MSDFDKWRSDYKSKEFIPVGCDKRMASAWNAALAHERELLPCSHPKACLILKEPNGPIGSIHVFAEDDEYICAWCESLAHERQRVVEGLKAQESRMRKYAESCREAGREHNSPYSLMGFEYQRTTAERFADELAAFIKRLMEGK
jgi:hypothetical protein